MATSTGLDERLRTEHTSNEAMRAILADHHISGHDHVCPACGHRPTRQHPMCRSAAIASSLLAGKHPHWVPEPATGQQGRPDTEQMTLFPIGDQQ